MFPVSPREEDETWIWCEPVALVESNDPETPPAIYRRLLPSFLARSGCCIELILIRRDRLRFYGSKWATPLPQRRVRRSRVPNNPSLRDVFEISQEHQRSGQRVLLSICGYSLALDAGRKNFLSETGPGKTISFSSVRQDSAPISQVRRPALLRFCAGATTHNATVRILRTMSSTEVCRWDAKLVLKSTVQAG
jgi:hypothetical protein